SDNLTDGNGTGIVLVTLQQGNGTLNTSSSGAGITFASYNASCCSEVVELVMVDDVGNAGVCSASIRGLSSATTPQTPTANTTVMQIATTSQTPIANTTVMQTATTSQTPIAKVTQIVTTSQTPIATDRKS